MYRRCRYVRRSADSPLRTDANRTEGRGSISALISLKLTVYGVAIKWQLFFRCIFLARIGDSIGIEYIQDRHAEILHGGPVYYFKKNQRSCSALSRAVARAKAALEL